MSARVAYIAALLFALGAPISANALDAVQAGQNRAGEQRATLNAQHQSQAQDTGRAVVITPPSTDDVAAMRGPDANARALRQIAIYQSVGNQTGAEILSHQLRTFGVTKEKVSEAVTWEKLHTAPQSAIAGAESAQPVIPVW